MVYTENPELEQDRLAQTLDLYQREGRAVWREQMAIYCHLSTILNDKRILEVGCGLGLGSALLSQKNDVVGTDKLEGNVSLASAFYPWVLFQPLDITQCTIHGFDVTICIDVIEHIRDYRQAIKNLISTAPEVWISTPNRNHPEIGNERAINSYHVKEFTPVEMLEMIGDRNVTLHDWESFKEVDRNTMVTPLVYKIERG